MSTEYLTIHTTFKSLADDAKGLVDDYAAKKITEDELSEVLAAWNNNCPNLLFETEGRGELASSIVRYIGKRRSSVIMTVLNRQLSVF